MVMNMGLMPMLPLHVLMGLMSVLQGRMVVLVSMLGYQVFHLAVPALDVVGQMDVLMGMDHFFMSVFFKSGAGH
jgi:hypothetical protein